MKSNSIEAQLAALHQEAKQAIEAITSQSDLDAWQIQFSGRKSDLSQISQQLKDVPAEQKAAAGQALNTTKQMLTELYQQKVAALKQADPRLDMSIPAASIHAGHTHLTSQTIQEIVTIFSQLGMNFVEAPEADYDWYVFESLNMPKTHPARDDWETFFVDLPADPEKGRVVLRPHTTNFELHVMENTQPPIRTITVGKTYRRQADASHTPMFHQFEGLVVDKQLSIGNLIATLEYFVHNFFGPNVKTRLRPYHFRFTEPSFEVDISCSICNGVGCKLCKEGWLELGGAGMTHPVVLRNGGIDPEVYSGFAWGFGVERCMAIRHGIEDIRMIYENDIRFLEQF